jgi:hypothetical protein
VCAPDEILRLEGAQGHQEPLLLLRILPPVRFTATFTDRATLDPCLASIVPIARDQHLVPFGGNPGGAVNAISTLDAAWILQSVMELRHLNRFQQIACDVTGNGTVSALDAALVLRYKVSLVKEPFPVSLACGSDWAFVPVPSPLPNQTVLEPAMTLGSCQAGSILYNPLAEAAAGQDFLAIAFGDCTGNWQAASGTPTPTRMSTSTSPGPASATVSPTSQ